MQWAKVNNLVFALKAYRHPPRLLEIWTNSLPNCGCLSVIVRSKPKAEANWLL
jgi:hypothetical protein